jgi:hydrogenase maturation protein HypF
LTNAIAAMAEEIRKETGFNRVVLSGGCFQNRLLLEGCLEILNRSGFEVFTHCDVPTNDGGIALGQAVIAAAKVRKKE